MAVPGDPVAAGATGIVSEGLRRGGITNPSTQQIADGVTFQLQEVKTDIELFAPEHPELLTQEVIICVPEQSVYDWPTTAYSIDRVVLLEGNDDRRGTATAGANTTVTLAADFSFEENDVAGKWIVILQNTGSAQIRQIIGYNDSTKVATVDTAWTTNPDNTSTYVVVDYHKYLNPADKGTDFNRLRSPMTRGVPDHFYNFDTQIWLDRAPDREYVLWVDYWEDLNRLDETGTHFVRLLREWRSLWIQGIAVKVMQRFDDDRYPAEIRIYDGMLANLAGAASSIGQVVYRDV